MIIRQTQSRRIRSSAGIVSGTVAWILAACLGTAPALAQEAARAQSASLLAPADAGASRLPRLHSMLISYRGELVFERYYNGTGPERQANLKSASKSVISALVGMAIERGLIPGIDQPIGDYFPDLLAGEENASKRAITIKDLLTMRSGLETTSNRNYGAWVVSSNWIRHALNMPIVARPGGRMIYSTGNTHLLSAILTRVTGASTWDFANQHLARPMGFSLARWLRDPQGIYFGGNDMTMTPRQILAFGELYINGGRANGEQVVPESWIRDSLVARTASPREQGRFYGYGWWIRPMGGHAVYYAWGYGGQFVFVVPTLDLVVVTTSDSDPGPERQQHLRRIYELVEYEVVGPLSAGGPETVHAVPATRQAIE